MGRSAFRHRQQGMTLIEIMIALLIGAFILGGVLQVFVNSKRSYNVQENLSQLQEGGRFAMGFIRADLRMAGFWECSPKPDIADPMDAGGVGGTNDIGTGTNISAVTGTGTDTIAITWQTGTWAGNVCTSNPGGSTITRYAISPATDEIATHFSLFRRIGNAPPQELIEGVDDLQILYGVDPDRNDETYSPGYYVPANLVTDWSNVISIRVTLVMATLETVGTSQNVNPNFPDDHRIRRTFTTTINLRNQFR